MDTPERQYQKNDIVELYDSEGYPLYMQAIVLDDEAEGDTHIHAEYLSYPGGRARIERQYLRLFAHGG